MRTHPQARDEKVGQGYRYGASLYIMGGNGECEVHLRAIRDAAKILSEATLGASEFRPSGCVLVIARVFRQSVTIHLFPCYEETQES